MEFEIKSEEQADPALGIGDAMIPGGVEVTVNTEEAAETPAEKAPDLIGGKFKTHDDLLKAYQELEKKSSKSPTEKPKAAETTTAESPAEIDMQALGTEVAESGALSEASLKSLEAAGVKRSVAVNYVKGQLAIANQLATEVHSVVGGKEQFDAVAQWAAVNADADLKDAWNAAIKSGNKSLVKTTLAAVVAQYTAATGSDPRLVRGGTAAPSQAGVKPFADQHEMITAINDPRYMKSEAYRKGVDARIVAS